MIALLTLLTEKGVKFEWSQEAKNALTKCKAAVAEAYIPKFPDLNKLFEPFTDACLQCGQYWLKKILHTFVSIKLPSH